MNGVNGASGVNSVNGGNGTKKASQPEYGKRLIVDIVDQRARDEPNREWISVPVSSDVKDGWRPITYKQAANAINHVAHVIVATTGVPEPGTFPTVAYIGPDDARYPIVALGAVKAGCQALFISPRNPIEGQRNLFNKTDCKVLYYTPQFKDSIKAWMVGREHIMKAVLVESVKSWMPDEEVEPYPYNKTFEEAEWDPLLVLHTSGSTGLPKPVVWRQGMLFLDDRYHHLPEKYGSKFVFNWMEEDPVGHRVLMTMPLFHAAGMGITMVLVHYYNMPAVFRIPDRPVSDDMVLDALRHSNATSMVVAPAMLEQLAGSDEAVDEMAKLRMVAFGGGPLAPKVGDRLVERGVALQNFISATEFCVYPLYWQTVPQDWNYIILDSEIMGCEYRKAVDDEEVYEQVVVRKGPKGSPPGWQGHFYTFPDAAEYSTKDLWTPHPTRPNNWLYWGRADDIIVFSNGEKLNPVTMEEMVVSHPRLHGVLVVGAGHFQAGMLVEPYVYPETPEEREALIDEIWPLVEKANEETVTHGRIARELIAISNPAKPFSRAGKGTVQRASTTKLYADEIEKLFEGVDAPTEVVELDLGSREALAESLKQLFPSRKLDRTTDFFVAGIDSLDVARAVKTLQVGLKEAGADLGSAIAPRFIYSNPTLERLAQSLFASLHKDGQNGHAEEDFEVKASLALLEKYTKDLPAPVKDKPEPATADQTVLITGTTGALGSYMLDLALASPAVKKVVCLNRTADAEARQTRSAAEKGLRADWGDRAEFLHADLSKPALGLGTEVYDRLLHEADRVVHGSWPVNFNMTVSSFEPSIRGVRHLVDFSARATKNVPVVFVSSIGTVMGWPHAPRPVPEEPLDDFRYAQAAGYGHSKLVSSLLLDRAAQVSGVPTAVVRVGQIAGPGRHREGKWNPQEWFPSLIKSSLHLGLLPDNLGLQSRVDWMPTEDVADVVLAVAGITNPKLRVADVSGYFHVVNPATVPWSELVPAVTEFYEPRIKKVVPLPEWVDALEKSQASTANLDDNPGVKLLDTYKAWTASADRPNVVLDTTRTQAYSETLRTSKAITPELLKLWCEQWQF